LSVEVEAGMSVEEESVVAERLRLWTGDTLEEDAWLIRVPPSPGFPPADDVTRRFLTALSDDGPGFVVLRGLAPTGLDDQAGADLCRAVLARVGTPRPEGSAAPLDHFVTGVGAPRTPVPAGAGDPPRGSAAEDAGLAPHTDRAGPPGPPRLLGLLCVRPAPKGGESLLVSGHTVHRRLSGDRPSVLPALHGDFHFGAERTLARSGPVFAPTGGRLRVQYNRYQIERGHEAAGEPLTAAQVEALDAVDEVLDDESLFLRVPLRRGDLLVLDNHAVLHGRAPFTDHPDPLRRRCLARVWAD